MAGEDILSDKQEEQFHSSVADLKPQVHRGGGTYWAWKVNTGGLWVQVLFNLSSQFSNNIRTMSDCFKTDKEKQCVMRSPGMIPKAFSHAKSWKYLWDLSSVFGDHCQVLLWEKRYRILFFQVLLTSGEKRIMRHPRSFPFFTTHCLWLPLVRHKSKTSE